MTSSTKERDFGDFVTNQANSNEILIARYHWGKPDLKKGYIYEGIWPSDCDRHLAYAKHASHNREKW